MTKAAVEILAHGSVAFHFDGSLWRLYYLWRHRAEWLPYDLTDCAWLLFAAYWLVTALVAKKPSRTETSGERMGHIIFMIIGFMLLNSSAPPFLNWLNRGFVPDRRWIAWLGASITLAGVMFAIWARRTIGKEWSAEVQIKQGHELIRSGPYARIRHPIYTGILLAVAGTALAIGQYRGLAALAVMAIGFARKANKEEAFLALQFGPAFEEHRRQTGFFLPRVS